MNRFLILLFSLTTTYSAKAQIARPEEFRSKYKLAKVMMMGRHHVRSGSITNREHRVTPHEWHQWEVEEGNLTQRGALLEQQMGVFFNMWLSKEQLLDFSDPSSADSVLIYANSMERTIETGRNFAKGLMPGIDLPVVYNTSVEMGKMDPVFNTVSSKTSDVLKKKANAEIDMLCGEGGLREAISRLEQDAEVMADIIDMTSSTGCLEANACSFHFDNPYISLSRNAMPKIQGGNLYTAQLVSGNLILQYYDMPESAGQIFGHEITEEQLYTIGRVKDLWCHWSMSYHSVGTDICHLFMEKMREEITNPVNKIIYLVGHDSTIAGLTGALEMEEYTLPATPECKTPLGGKIVVEVWQDENKQQYVALNYVYQSAQQILGLDQLSQSHPPMMVPLSLKTLEQNADGLYPFEQFMGILDNAIDAYDTLDEYLPNDVNLDRKVDMLDVVDIILYLKGIPFKHFVSSVADINKDGSVTEMDVHSLISKVAEP